MTTGDPSDPDTVRLPDSRMIRHFTVERSAARPPAPVSADDQEAPDPTVRPYVISQGRTASAGADLAVEVQVRAVPGGTPAGAAPEVRHLLELCRPASQSIAEIGAALHLPIGVVRVLVGDLLEAGAVVVGQHATVSQATIEHVLERIHAL
jgi:Protein of unknown function (DUF742)